ncbi:MAG: flavin reductase family protein [Verrucomicrobia bacterium]|nr:flavin reductase family protein [Verrucomicrobiota bacterium]
MLLNFENLSVNAVYYTMIQTIVPRPIAWVLSEHDNGAHNLAPFSYFNGVSSNPPIVSISVGRKDNGSQKDTWHNIEQRSNFVIHIPHRELAEQVTASAASLDAGESEIDLIRMETTSTEGWPLPRLSEARIALLCERFAIHALGAAPQGLILGRIMSAYLDDSIASHEGKRLTISAKRLDPIARLGGNDYATLGDILTIERPK